MTEVWRRIPIEKGTRIGSLTVACRIDPVELGSLGLMQCECDCGAIVRRTEGALRKAKLRAANSGCKRCARKRQAFRI